MAIEITDEMIRDIRERIGGSEIAARSAAEAILAIVERDYDVRPKFGPADHPFQPHKDPAFGAFFGGGCGAEVDGTLCSWPRGAHRRLS